MSPLHFTAGSSRMLLQERVCPNKTSGENPTRKDYNDNGELHNVSKVAETSLSSTCLHYQNV